MDKLRAIEYFVRTVEAGSFGAAARSLDVSTPAVSQLVGTLERSLGIALLHRSPRGIALTADGRRYYEVLHRLTDDLRDIERQLGPGLRPRGTLTVGMRAGVAQACVMPHIARFLARYPEVDLILKPVETLEEVDSQDLDIAVMLEAGDLGDGVQVPHRIDRRRARAHLQRPREDGGPARGGLRVRPV